MREFLKQKGINDKGKKDELMDRIMVYMTHQNEI